MVTGCKFSSSLRCGTALAVVFTFAIYGANSALAACSGIGSPIVTCSTTSTGVIEDYNNTTNKTVTATNWTFNNGRFHLVVVNGPNRTVTFTGTNVTVNGGNGSLGTAQSNGVIHMGNQSVNGAVTITLSDSNLTITGPNSQGLSAQSYNPAGNSGTATVNVTNVDINMTNADGRAALNAVSDGKGNAFVMMTGGNITTSGANPLNTDNLYAAARAFSQTGNVSVTTVGGTLTTLGNAYGISAMTAGAGTATVDNTAIIDTRGPTADGIYAETSSGAINVTNAATITTAGANARGIVGRTAGATTLDNSGVINAGGAGIYVNAGTDVLLGNSANVTSANAAGITAFSTNGAVTLNVNSGIITALNDFAISAMAPGAGATATVNILAGAEAHGGVSGVMTAGETQKLNNAGLIDSLLDVAIVSVVGSTYEINNTGTIIGNVVGASPVITVNNSGTWDLRGFADMDGDHVRETWAIAVSDLGPSAGNTINNTGTLRLVAQAGSSAATFDATGAYLPGGLAANTPVAGGAVQAQILGVQTFNNSGLIDLTGGGSVPGNVLVITGGTTPGTDGGGVFVANGGTVRLNTVLNDGGANSISDVLVVDSTRLGTAATKLQVNAVGGVGAYTPGNGIMLVEVLNKDASATGVFAQEGRIVGGAFEYTLHQGGVGGSAADGNWYLRSEAAVVPPPPPPEPGCEATNSCPKPPPVVPQFRPEVGAYLGNQMAAVAMFRHTLHDRLGEVDYLERQRGIDEGRHAASWVRVTGNLTDSEAAMGQLDLRTTTGMAQAGFELGRWTDGDSRLLLGVMAGAGMAHTTSRSLAGDYDAKGDVTGYSVGLYGTWYQSAADARGLYIDTWVQHGWYDNTVKGEQLASESYNSRALSASLEAGYAFELARGERRAYFFEPQAQVIYTDYSANAHREANGTVVTPDDAGGFLTRLGARIYNRQLTMEAGPRVQPFLEFNWWHAMEDNSVAFNGYSVAQDMPRNTYEVKLGAEAELDDRWTMWGHAGLRLGANEFRDVDLLLGAKYSW